MSDAINQQHRTTTLWRDFRGKLHAFLNRRLPTSSDADDVLQDIFIRIHKGADRLDAVRNIEAWVFTIARRAIADFYRESERRVDEETLTSDSMPTAEPAMSVLLSHDGGHDVHEEVLSWIIPMIEELPDKYSVAVRMADVEGKTQQAIADYLGLSLSGAKSRVQRGRVLLGDVLQACCEVEFGNDGRVIAYERKTSNCDTNC